ncbi:hypothetical protein PFISCL1PPCAC_11024, partial [Pristionchus fissidentatus]
VVKARNKFFLVSSSYLSLHSLYFHRLFHGPNVAWSDEMITLDVDPNNFADLLTLIQSSDSYHQDRDTTSHIDHLSLALQLQ